MSELYQKDLKPLGPVEVDSFLRQTREAGFTPNPSSPTKPSGHFQKSNLIEIARAAAARSVQQNDPLPEAAPDPVQAGEMAEDMPQATPPLGGENTPQENVPDMPDRLAVADAVENVEAAAETDETQAENELPPLSEQVRAPSEEMVAKAAADIAVAEALERGIQQGLAQGIQETEERLKQQIVAFEKLITSTINFDPLDVTALTYEMNRKIVALASERAGMQIAEDPQPFMARIERIAETVNHAQETPTIYLSGADYDVVAALLVGRETLQKATIVRDDKLVTGDLRIQVGQVGLSDKLADRVGLDTPPVDPQGAESKFMEIGETMQKLLNEGQDADQMSLPDLAPDLAPEIPPETEQEAEKSSGDDEQDGPENV